MTHPVIDQLSRLPVGPPEDYWVATVAHLPGLVGKRWEIPVRPRAPFWASQRGFHMAMPKGPGDLTDEQSLPALAEFVAKYPPSHRPAQVKVEGAELAQFLKQALAPTGIEVEEVAELPMVRALMEDLDQNMNPDAPPPLISGKGITEDHLLAFAEAARLFWSAEPWQHLNDWDPLEIKTGLKAIKFKYAVVMGSSRQTYGLALYESQRQYANTMNAGGDPDFIDSARWHWAMTFDPEEQVRFPDWNMWRLLRAGVPIAGRYPAAGGMDFRTHSWRPPSARQLTYVEAVLRALAATTEPEIDAGQWTRTVQTADGEVTVDFSLPRMKDPAWAGVEEQPSWMESETTGSPDPVEQARALTDEAWEARGRRQIQVARQAVALYPDATDALVILAGRAGNPTRAMEAYRQAAEAGQRELGEAYFRDLAGEFWGILETRPYMRAMMGLASSAVAAGQLDEAATALRRILTLNPGDNQGARYSLLGVLLALGRNAEAEQLLTQYDEDSAAWEWARVLLAFRKHGDTDPSRAAMRRATKANPHVPEALMDWQAGPGQPQPYTMGSEEEAANMVLEQGDAWRKTPGAMEWLERMVQVSRRPAGRRRR